jgi:hypothetical protein
MRTSTSWVLLTLKPRLWSKSTSFDVVTLAVPLAPRSLVLVVYDWPLRLPPSPDNRYQHPVAISGNRSRSRWWTVHVMLIQRPYIPAYRSCSLNCLAFHCCLIPLSNMDGWTVTDITIFSIDLFAVSVLTFSYRFKKPAVRAQVLLVFFIFRVVLSGLFIAGTILTTLKSK